MPKRNASIKENSSQKLRKMKSVTELKKLCNVVGLNDDNLLNNICNESVNRKRPSDIMYDCLDELAAVNGEDRNSRSNLGEPECCTDQRSVTAKKPLDSYDSHSPVILPPKISEIPNLKIELSRHLKIQNISNFLLYSCEGLRMPSFERWLLDSKLEEMHRYNEILNNLMNDSSLSMVLLSGEKKKKYGRSALYAPKNEILPGKETYRREKESRLMLELITFSPGSNRNIRGQYGPTWKLISHRDPIIPSHPLETDPSSVRLLEEIAATMLSNPIQSKDTSQHRKHALDIVRELCSRAIEATNDLKHLEIRLGKYQKFGWDMEQDVSRGKSMRKSHNTGSRRFDKIFVEWHPENQICSIIYNPKKRKVLSSESTEMKPSPANNKTISPHQHESKPFVVKLNAAYYYKLRSMFDATNKNLRSREDCIHAITASQAEHAFHAILFATIIRYSSLSGGQLLNDWRGGGMQGAVHDGVFDCLKKWFGAKGTECFASPFNCTLHRYYSAFSSPDIDGYFGSNGDFFHHLSHSAFLSSGWYQVNPPFSPGIMSKMAQEIDDLLNEACKRNLDVTFIVIIPTCVNSPCRALMKQTTTKSNVDKDEVNNISRYKNAKTCLVNSAASASFDRLVYNSHCISHVILPPREHGYKEGSQHLRPTKFKESQYSTSVITLRSKTNERYEKNLAFVARSWDEKLFERDIREAFASRHEIERNQCKGRDE